METESSHSNSTPSDAQKVCKPHGLRECPNCGLMTIFGMPGGADSTCKNCGYKDPCCTDR